MPKSNNSSRRELHARERRDLDIEIGFLEGVVRRDPEYVDALLLLADDYTRRGRVEDGLQADLRLRQLRPDDPLVHYNLACSLALTGQLEKAVDTLERALDLGYRDFRWLQRDPDLRPLRRHPAYRRIRERIKALQLDARE